MRALVHLFGTGPDVFVVQLQTCNATLLPAKTLGELIKKVPACMPYLDAVTISQARHESLERIVACL